MKKNLYYREVVGRNNILKKVIYDFAQKFASYPKIIIEVFLRKNFGERYFSLASSITVAVILALIPLGLKAWYDSSGAYRFGPMNFWLHYGTWYVFLAAFIYFFIKRNREIKHNPSVFDFEKFSLYSGDIDKRFRNPKYLGFVPNIRTIEIYLEPAVFFVAGIALAILQQTLSNIFWLVSIIYAISYAAQYKKGDHFVMDKIDEMIMNEEMETAFVEDEPADKTRGVRFYAKKPNARDLRKKVSENFIETTPSEEPTYAL